MQVRTSRTVMIRNKVVSAIMITILICSMCSTAYAGVKYDVNFDASVIPGTPGSGANEWQIMYGGYAGSHNGSDVSESFDNKANVSYSDDNAVRMTKNVISTDKENEFIMHLNIEPQVSWEDILQLNTLMVTNANKAVSPPNWPEAGQPSYLRPEKSSDYSVPVQIEYYAMEKGKKISIAKTTMYSSTQEVPNGAYGVGNPLLEPSGGTFDAGNNFNLKETGNEGISTAEIDISTVYKKYELSMQNVYPKTAKEQLGKHILINEKSLNYDGGKCSVSNDVVNWTLPDKDLGLLPYKIDSKGNVSPSGVLRKLENGKSTYYREDAYRMSYRFTLTVEDDDFISCGSADSSNDITAKYALQTIKSPDSLNDKKRGGMITYKVNGNNGTGYYKAPYIKGLLYNLEFQKVIEASKVPLEGVEFTIERKSGGNYHSENVVFSDVKLSGKDGWTKFRNMPWGEYTIKETAYQEGNEFQNSYLKQDLPRVIASVKIGQVINGSALIDDHDSLHECDAAGDVENQLFILKEGTVENAPYRAKVTICKKVKFYDDISDKLKSSAFAIKTASKDIYLKPESEDVKLAFIDEETSLKHNEKVTYDLMVPENGGTLMLEEIIPEKIRGNIVFGSITAAANEGSLPAGSLKEKKQGCSLEVMPGSDITVTVTNIPVGKVYIKNVTENYRSELADDAVIIQAVSSDDGSGKVDSQTVLKHNETSPAIKVTEPTEITVTQILPKEYTFSDITLAGGGQLKENHVTVNPGEVVTVAVHNRYENIPFFHVSDTIKNSLKWK